MIDTPARFPPPKGPIHPLVTPARVAAAAAAALAVLASSASAATIGNDYVGATSACDGITLTVPTGETSDVVPFDGVLTSWSTRAESAGNRMAAVVYRLDGGDYTLVGISDTQVPVGTGVKTYPTHIAVRAGDLFGSWVDKRDGVHDVANTCSADAGPGQTTDWWYDTPDNVLPPIPRVSIAAIGTSITGGHDTAYRYDIAGEIGPPDPTPAPTPAAPTTVDQPAVAADPLGAASAAAPAAPALLLGRWTLGDPATAVGDPSSGNVGWSAPTCRVSDSITASTPVGTYPGAITCSGGAGGSRYALDTAATAAVTVTAASGDSAASGGQANEVAPTVAIASVAVQRGTTVTTEVRPSGAGTVRVGVTFGGRPACAAVHSATSASRMAIPCALNARARAALRVRSVTFTVTTTFTDAAGKTATATRTVSAARYRLTVPVLTSPPRSR